MKPCAMLIWDREASRGGTIVFRPCGAKTGGVVTIRGDTMFAVCSRHNQRLIRAGVDVRKVAT